MSAGVGSPTFFHYLTTLVDPTLLIIIATMFAVIELCWRRWRYGAPPELTLFALPKSKYFYACFLLAVVATIAIPAVWAFTFMFWLTPVDIRAMYGY